MAPLHSLLPVLGLDRVRKSRLKNEQVLLLLLLSGCAAADDEGEEKEEEEDRGMIAPVSWIEFRMLLRAPSASSSEIRQGRKACLAAASVW